MSIFNITIMIVIVIGTALFMPTHQKGTFLINVDEKIPKEKLEKANRDSTFLFIMKILSLLVSAISAAVFFTTEKMDEEYITMNGFSVIHLLLLIAFIVIVVLGVKEVKRSENKGIR